MSDQNADVVVIGAGIAGLASVQAFCDAGLRVTVLEARNRIGGRICHRRFRHPGRWVSLRDVWNIVDRAGLRTHEITGGRWSLANDETARAGGSPGAASS